MQTTYSIVIDAEPSQVFYWLDDPERLKQWVPNLIENENLKVTEDKVGSTFRQVYDEHGRHMEMHGVVSAYETNRRLACEIEGDSFDLSLGYRLDDLGKQTRLTQDCTIRFKGSFKIIAFLMGPFIKKSSKKQLEGCFAKLKALAEEPQT